MRSNGLLKWLMLPVLALVIFAAVRWLSDTPGPALPSADTGLALSAEERRALGVEGDTPQDTVATLVAQVRQLRHELQTALTDNRTQRAENDRLRQRERSIEQRIQTALDTERSQLRQDRELVTTERHEVQRLLDDLQRQLEDIASDNSLVDLPVGLGLESGDGVHFAEHLHWIDPQDARPEKPGIGVSGGLPFPGALTATRNALSTAAGTNGSAAARQPDTSPSSPVYTVPANATLMGSVAMTALIGRIPIDGTVNDPYPFKVIIGRDNLTANGIEIPDVAGAVVSGTASGDWTLSCVRGQIRSITFVFEDGTIRTLPEDGRTQSSGGSRQGSLLDGLGWISDPQGIPCVAGARRSNAQQYLGTQALITAAGAGAASLIEADSGRLSYVGSDGSLGSVGISANEAMGRILAGGVQDMSQWVNKLYGQAFAAVYVEPGAQVAVHIEQPLTLDYDADGRKTNHRLRGGRVADLD